MAEQKTITVKTLAKSNVWGLQENDIFRIWAEAEKEGDLKDYARHFMNVASTAFEMEEVKIDHERVIQKYENLGYLIGFLPGLSAETEKWAIKKRAISRVTDLTSDNIRHITAAQLLEVIDRNFGGGWESLSSNVQTTILSAFDISTTTLPKDRLHNPGGIYEKMTAEEYDALEIAKGTWVEVIFAKLKPETISASDNDIFAENKKSKAYSDDEDDDEDIIIEDEYDEEDDDSFDEDALDQESYRTEFDTSSDDITLDDMAAAEDEY